MTDERHPVEIFTTDASKRNRLSELLADPVLAEAFGIADDLLRPKSGTTADTNQALSIAKFHQSAGAEEFQKTLRNLSREHIKRKPPTVKTLASSTEDLKKDSQ